MCGVADAAQLADLAVAKDCSVEPGQHRSPVGQTQEDSLAVSTTQFSPLASNAHWFEIAARSWKNSASISTVSSMYCSPRSSMSSIRAPYAPSYARVSTCTRGLRRRSGNGEVDPGPGEVESRR